MQTIIEEALNVLSRIGLEVTEIIFTKNSYHIIQDSEIEEWLSKKGLPETTTVKYVSHTSIIKLTKE